MTCVAARHGTATAYQAYGCRCPEAKAAQARYRKQLRHAEHTGNARRVPAVGTHRRIQALAAIGWSIPEQMRRAGYRCGGNNSWILYRDTVHVRTAARFQALYDELWDTPGPSKWTRTFAANRGWPPPAAWDDDTIDDPAAWANVSLEPDDDYVDPVVVDRLIAGADWQALGATRAERIAAAERLAWHWTPIRARQAADGTSPQALDGESLTSIERRFGLRAGRDFRKAPDAVATRGAA